MKIYRLWTFSEVMFLRWISFPLALWLVWSRSASENIVCLILLLCVNGKCRVWVWCCGVEENLVKDYGYSDFTVFWQGSWFLGLFLSTLPRIFLLFLKGLLIRENDDKRIWIFPCRVVFVFLLLCVFFLFLLLLMGKKNLSPLLWYLFPLYWNIMKK